ncbi:MAG: glycosyl hydrolase-related protein, partial [Chloroflexota bacterium]|nr:glycosyl hydrolase-related protein [Chloroflexota bacterium]
SEVSLAVGAVKRALEGDGLIVRVYEPHGARGRSILQFAGTVKRAEKVNLLEEPLEDAETVEVEGNAVTFNVRPFEVITLRVEL